MAVKDVYLDHGLRGWIINTARKECWRLPRWYEPHDLVQDGFVCYCKCRDKYALKDPEPGHPPLNTDTPNEVQRRHFMALVKTAFYNHIMTLSSNFAASQEEALPESGPADERATLEKLLPPQPEEASLRVALASAPAELKDVVERLLRDGVEGTAYVRSRLYVEGNRVRRGRRALRETTSQFWRRVLGDANLPKEIAAYLQS
jgi:hypothetical protein